MKWIERHITEYTIIDGEEFFVCPHCDYKIRINPVKIMRGNADPNVSHYGSVGAINVSMSIEEEEE